MESKTVSYFMSYTVKWDKRLAGIRVSYHVILGYDKQEISSCAIIIRNDTFHGMN